MDSIQWQSFLISCLDILRNGKSKFDGLKAINEIITLITLKLIENRITDETCYFNQYNDNVIKIGNDCKMSHLYETYCKHNKANELYDLLYNKNRIWITKQQVTDNLDVISENKIRNDNVECIIIRFNKYTDKLANLTTNITYSNAITTFSASHASDVLELISKIHETFKDINLDHFNYDAFGQAYERMLSDELGNNSKRYGQYFTKRQIIDLIINELNIQETDKCYDPACGTGGFVMGFSKKTSLDNIYGQEILQDVYKTLCFNLLGHGQDGCLKNIKLGDSMEHEYHEMIKNKFDIVGANPPFGLSITSTLHSDYKIKVKNSVACFIQHIIHSLKEGGRAGVIIDRGILNNGCDKGKRWEKELRKYILENVNLYKIINLPTGIFKHTNFATSIIFFVKGPNNRPFGKGYETKEIQYIEGYFNKMDKGKGDKLMHLGETKILDIERIKDKNYSLKYEDYFSEQEKENDGCEYIRLGEIVNFNIGGTPSRRESKYYNGINLWVSISDMNNKIINETKEKITELGIKNSNVKLIEKGSILMSFKLSIGKMGIAGTEMYCNEAIMYFKHENDFTNKYLYYWLLLNNKQIIKFASGGIGKGSLNKTSLANIKIPNIPLNHQTEIVNFLDNIYETNNIEDTIKYINHDIFSLLITKNFDTFHDIIFYQNNIQFVASELENVKRKKNLYTRSLFNTVKSKSEMKNLGEICNLERGKILKINDLVKGDIPVIGGGVKPMGYHNKYNRNENTIVCSSSGANAGYISRYNTKIWASDCFSIINKYENNSINNDYIYYYLKYNQNKIFKLQHGNGQPHVNTNDLKSFRIPIPSLELQDHVVNEIQKTYSESFHYNIYENNLKQELQVINETIKNLTENCIMENELIIDNEIDINFNDEFEQEIDNEIQENNTLII
jgi:type I restriction-modification system DNA methylase subunit